MGSVAVIAVFTRMTTNDLNSELINLVGKEAVFGAKRPEMRQEYPQILHGRAGKVASKNKTP